VPELHSKPRRVCSTRNFVNIESHALNYVYNSRRNVIYTAHALADRTKEQATMNYLDGWESFTAQDEKNSPNIQQIKTLL
jgi:hypothetical protein